MRKASAPAGARPDDEVIDADGAVLEARATFVDGHRGHSDGRGFRLTNGNAVSKRASARLRPADLADPSFYHLDTAFCLLPCGGVIYHPGVHGRSPRRD